MYNNNNNNYRTNGGGNYGQKRNGNYNNNYQQKPKKHSGAKHTKYFPTTGVNKGFEQNIVNAWKLSKNKELIKVTAVTTSKSKESEKGWFGSVAVTFVNTVTGAKFFYWGTMQKSTGKVIVQDLALVINPKAPNGGYCGTFVKS